jgi:hypothetical protein
MVEYNWVTIFEYCELRKKSISTVRRYIKADRIKYKMIDGKYYVAIKKTMHSKPDEKYKMKNIELELLKLKEENLELKMLIDLYETKINFGSEAIL